METFHRLFTGQNEHSSELKPVAIQCELDLIVSVQGSSIIHNVSVNWFNWFISKRILSAVCMCSCCDAGRVPLRRMWWAVWRPAVREAGSLTLKSSCSWISFSPSWTVRARPSTKSPTWASRRVSLFILLSFNFLSFFFNICCLSFSFLSVSFLPSFFTSYLCSFLLSFFLSFFLSCLTFEKHQRSISFPSCTLLLAKSTSSDSSEYILLWLNQNCTIEI